jgi:hypothetical protein
MDAKQFILHLNFAGRSLALIVMEIREEGARQYTIRPEDRILFERYGSQIIHVFDEDHPLGFLIKEDEEHQAFWGAAGKALRLELQSSIGRKFLD